MNDNNDLKANLDAENPAETTTDMQPEQPAENPAGQPSGTPVTPVAATGVPDQASPVVPAAAQPASTPAAAAQPAYTSVTAPPAAAQPAGNPVVTPAVGPDAQPQANYYVNQNAGLPTGAPVYNKAEQKAQLRREKQEAKARRKATREAQKQFALGEKGGSARGRSRWIALVATGVAACVIGAFLGGFIANRNLSPQINSLSSQVSSLDTQLKTALSTSGSSATSGSSDSSSDSNTTTSSGTAMSVADIAASASSSVVAINTSSSQETYFGTQTVEGAGSGVVVSADGYILTNNHVIDSSTATVVTMSDGTQYDATIVSTDSVTDLAIIKIDADNLDYLTFGDSTQLRVGDPVVAIGNPLGELQGTVTSGVISALNRSITVSNTTMSDVIQTDAAINSGNSGGALINQYGELIGINVAKTSEVGVEGIAFAIPSEVFEPIVQQMLETGTVQRPMLGITGADIAEDNSYGFPEGILITAVMDNSPASEAGLTTYDIITDVDGQGINTIEALNSYKADKSAGDTLELTVVRQGQEMTVQITLALMDGSGNSSSESSGSESSGN